ncbi:MAG: carboxypeptidase regulatory-like domain-containing protein [Coriobacteriia bacterium]
MDTNGNGGRRAKRWASAVVVALLLVSAVPLVAQGAPAVGKALAEVGARASSAVRSASYALTNRQYWRGRANVPAMKVAMGDVNGDGKADALALYQYSGATAKVDGYISSGSAFGSRTMWSGTLSAPYAQIAAGDADGDHKADVFILKQVTATTSELWLLTSNGSTLARSVLWRGSLPFSRCKLTAGDVNGDGRADASVLYSAATGTGIWYVFAPSGSTAVSGVVKGATSNAGISGATVGVYTSGGTLVASGLTDASGGYNIPVVAGNAYEVRFSANGYLGVTYHGANIASGRVTYLETAYLVTTSESGSGAASGAVRNALNAQGVAGLSVALRSGMNDRTGSLLGYSATTGAGGAYSFASLPGGVYTAQVSGTGYVTTYFTVISVGGTTRANQDAVISPVFTGAAGQVRIVLTWGASPYDLDSHLSYYPAGSSTRTYHVYFSTPRYPSTGTTTAALDHDDTSAFGPETTTIYQMSSTGTYRFSVYNYSAGGSGTSLSPSGAIVRVYDSTGIRATFGVPGGRTGGLWTVFTMSNGVITPVNTVANYTSGSSSTVP